MADIIAQGMAGSAMKKAQSAIDQLAQLPKGVVYRGSVNYYSNLPNNPELGDAYTVKYTGSSGTTTNGVEYVWGINTFTNVAEWVRLGSDVEFTVQEKQLLQWLAEQALMIQVYGPED